MYYALTRSIRVTVVPEYLAQQSDPAHMHFVWAYHISIENTGLETVQLLNRYWRIIDGHGQQQEVRGAGVVGEQPVLAPGEAFRYTSGVPLHTSSGIMQGSYEFIIPQTGEKFDVEIPAFSLDSPAQTPVMN